MLPDGGRAEWVGKEYQHLHGAAAFLVARVAEVGVEIYRLLEWL